MSLLTADQLRGYIPDSADSDETLEQRIADTEAELNDRFGVLAPGGSGEEDIAEVIEEVYGYGRTELPLKQTPFDVIAVTDYYATLNPTPVELDPAVDWTVRGSYLVRRAGWRWGAKTVVRYVPQDARAARRRVLVKLIQLDMNIQPGMAQQMGGPWSESYPSSYSTAREDIMNTLAPPQELFA